MRTKYAVSIRGPIPANLAQRVAEAHAKALRKVETKLLDGKQRERYA